MSDEVMFFISQEQLDEFRKRTVKEAISAVRKEEAKLNKEKSPITKSKTALKAYRQLQIKYASEEDEIAFTREEEIELRYQFLEDLMGIRTISEELTKTENDLIKKEKAKLYDYYELTRIVEAADMYQVQCENSTREEDKIRWCVFYYTYFDEEERTMEDIADLCNIAKRTAYNYLNDAVKSFAFYLFGM